MSNENLAYYELRAAQELKAAAEADRPEVASAHRLLAIQYESHAGELRSNLQTASASVEQKRPMLGIVQGLR